MNRKISILHISDIHKAQEMKLDNLFNSLVRDKERWEEEGIRQPDFIVLSGDVIQGGPTEDIIAEQYNEAEKFLEAMCKEFLGGKREHMIIVPGNHDVSWPFSQGCMDDEQLTDETIKLYRQHKHPLRWDWNTAVGPGIKKIRSQEEYTHRFDRFVEFYNRFFDNIRVYPEEPERQAYCVAFEPEGICFACFNSCHQNDHLNDAGEIYKDAIYSIEGELRKCYSRGMLPIGVWHHNAYGDPYQTDYMSKDVLDKLLEHRIKIGLFGHQHKSQVAEEYSDLLISEESRKRLLLISSGTLFGCDTEQHKAIRRQFNLIELEMGNGEAEVKVSVREDGNNDISSDDPYWKAKKLPDGAIRYKVGFKHISDDEVMRRIDDETRRSGDFAAGVTALRQSGLAAESVGPLVGEYLKMVDVKTLFRILPEPEDGNQCFLLIGAIDKEHDKQAFERLKNSRVLQEEMSKDKMLQGMFAGLSEKF